MGLGILKASADVVHAWPREKTTLNLKVVPRALHSEFFSEHSSRVSSRNEFLRVGTNSEKARKTRSDPNFRKITNFREFSRFFRKKSRKS